jgi:hypothetical protein
MPASAECTVLSAQDNLHQPPLAEFVGAHEDGERAHFGGNVPQRTPVGQESVRPCRERGECGMMSASMTVCDEHVCVYE